MSALRLRLFVADQTPAARRAVEPVEAGLEARFAGAYELEVVDVLMDPASAMREGVFVTPTLVKVFPAPLERFVGDVAAALSAMAL